MRWDIVSRGLLRYTLLWGGLTSLIAYGGAALVNISMGTSALLLLLLGGSSLVLSLTGTTGTGAGAAAVEPASGVNIDPRDYAAKPIGSTNVRVFFWSLGVVFGAVAGLVIGG